MGKKRLAIIGNGMGTCRLLDELGARGGDALYEITVYGEEPGGAYDRIALGRVLAGDSPDSVVTKPPEWYDRRGIRLLARTRATRIDTLGKYVETEDGRRRRYDLVVLATGSQPRVPPLDGVLTESGELRPGAFVYRRLADCTRIRQEAHPGTSAVVVGGGLLGLEAAKALSDRGMHVTVVHVAPTLMNAQLDTMAGEMLRRQIERAGIFVRAGRTVESVDGDERIERVMLDDGTVLPADLLMLACGVSPRVDVAKASGLPVNKGIIVNDTLATEVPSVYAFGECAEHRGRTYGLAAPVWEQAAVLADVLSGTRPQSRYRGSKIYARLKVAGVDVASMGVIGATLESDEIVQVIEPQRNAYRKLVIRDGRLLGAMLVGNTLATATLVQLFDRGDPMPADPIETLCQPGAAANGSADALVCTCHKVTESALRQAIADGADSVRTLGEVTKAGTGCGSCKGHLGQLLANVGRPTTPAIGAVG